MNRGSIRLPPFTPLFCRRQQAHIHIDVTICQRARRGDSSGRRGMAEGWRAQCCRHTPLIRNYHDRPEQPPIRQRYYTANTPNNGASLLGCCHCASCQYEPRHTARTVSGRNAHTTNTTFSDIVIVIVMNIMTYFATGMAGARIEPAAV